MKRVCLLGASGSIGDQTIDILKKFPEEFLLTGISVGKRVEKAKAILDAFPSVSVCSLQKKEDAENLQKEYPEVTFHYGEDGILKVIDESKPTLVVNALVGFVGFVPSVHTLENNIDLALANKESLVVGGDIVNELLKQTSAKLYPIDSEHVALAKCLEGKKKEDVKRLVITASGGSFRDLSRDQLKDVTVAQALKHPSWSMGSKITIDSATMMNKGFEVIEAKHLFGFDIDQIAVLLHDESVIHSLVEFKDNSYLADLGPADMRVPITYALFGKNRHEVETRTLNLEDFSAIHFRKFDLKRYPCVGYALEAITRGGSAPCVVNASNEVAVYAFLDGEIGFLEIEELIEKALHEHTVIVHPSVDDLIRVDKETREATLKEIERRKKPCGTSF